MEPADRGTGLGEGAGRGLVELCNDSGNDLSFVFCHSCQSLVCCGFANRGVDMNMPTLRSLGPKSRIFRLTDQGVSLGRIARRSALALRITYSVL